MFQFSLVGKFPARNSNFAQFNDTNKIIAKEKA